VICPFPINIPRFLILSFFALTLRAQPFPSAATIELPLTTPSQYVPITSSSTVAGDGSRFFVVSSDSRYYYPGSSLLFGSVVGTGQPLPAPVTLQTYGGALPAAASSGRTYLVVSGALGGTSGQLVDRDGHLLSTFQIHPQTRTPFLPHDTGATLRSVAWDGEHYVVVTIVETVVAPFQIASSKVATIVDESGSVVQNDIPVDGLFVAGRNGLAIYANNPIAAGDDGFLETWIDNGSLYARHRAPNGEIDGPLQTLAPTGSFTPSVTWDGEGYLVAYTLPSGRGLNGVRVRRDGAEGSIAIDPNGYNPSAAWSGGRTLVAFTTELGTAAVFVDGTTVTPLGPIHLASNSQTSPLVASVDGEPMAMWSEPGAGVFLRARGYTTKLSSALGRPLALVAGPGEALAVWSSGGIFAQRIDAYGAPIGGRAELPTSLEDGVAAIRERDGYLLTVPEVPLKLRLIRIRPEAAVEVGAIDAYTSSVALARANDRTLIVWGAEFGNVDGAILDDAGTLTPTGRIAIPQDLPKYLSAASNGSSFLVSWISKGEQDIVAGRTVSANGAVGRSGPTLYSLGERDKRDARVFWTGTNYLVVWSVNGRAIDAVHVDGSGALLDYPPRRLATIDGALSEGMQFALAGPSTLLIGEASQAQAYGPTRAAIRYVTIERTRRARK